MSKSTITDAYSYSLDAWVELTLPAWPVSEFETYAEVAVTSDASADTDTILSVWSTNNGVIRTLDIAVVWLTANQLTDSTSMAFVNFPTLTSPICLAVTPIDTSTNRFQAVVFDESNNLTVMLVSVDVRTRQFVAREV